MAAKQKIAEKGGKPILPRGRTFVGTVVKAKAAKTATIEWQRWQHVPKYERFLRTFTRVKAHNPEHINAEKGDKVKIQECRPLSKTKKFIILEKYGKDIHYLEKEEGMEESKGKSKKAEEKPAEETQPEEKQ